MDSVVAVSRGGKAGEAAAVAAHAHMLQHQMSNENDLRQRGSNGHVGIDDHRNGNVMPIGGGGAGGSVYAESVISSAAPLVS